MKKKKLLAVSAVLLLIAVLVFVCKWKSHKVDLISQIKYSTKYQIGKNDTQMFNPIGLEYDNVIDYLELNDLKYKRTVVRGNNLIHYYNQCDIDKEHGEIIKFCSFNDDNICFLWEWCYPEDNYDAVLSWLDKNFNKVPQSMEWYDLKQSILVLVSGGIIMNNKQNHFKVGFFAGDYDYPADNVAEDKLILDCTIIQYLYDDTKEKTNWIEDNNRFVIPVDSNGEINGDIIHYRETGKKRIYKIIENFTHEIIEGVENKYSLIVNENDENAFFYYSNYNNSPFVEIMLDGKSIRFSNEDLEERMEKALKEFREKYGEEFGIKE